MVKKSDLKRLATLVVLPIFLAVFLSYNVFALGLVIKQESVVLSDGGGACLTYELFNSKSTPFTAQVSVSDGLAPVFESGSGPLIAANTPRDSAVPVEVCFQTPSNLANCRGDDRDFVGTVIFTEGGGSDSGGSAATLSVPVPMTVRVSCAEGSGGFSLLWFIVALILLVIVILLFVRKAQQARMRR